MSSSGNWDQNFLFDNLPNNIAEKVVALPDPSSGDGLDIIGWGGTNTRQFSVKSAYDMKTGIMLIPKGIGKVYGIGRVLIVYKLSFGWLLMIAF